MLLSREPCDCQIQAIRQDAKVRNEPHPSMPDNDSDDHWHQDAEHRTAPHREEWMGIGGKATMRQTPGPQISFLQLSATEPAADHMS